VSQRRQGSSASPQKTLRRAREGSFEDLSRRPKSSPRRLKVEFEQLILTEAKKNGLWPEEAFKTFVE